VPDAEIEDERSSIRPRHQPVEAEQRVMAGAQSGGASGGRPRPRMPSQPGAAEQRVSRIDQKLRIAKILLDDLPADDPRARLLRTAIVRRDEVLLDGILEELQARAKAESIAPPAGDPTTAVRKRRDQDD
jgi:hypothetical protein